MQSTSELIFKSNLSGITFVFLFAIFNANAEAQSLQEISDVVSKVKQIREKCKTDPFSAVVTQDKNELDLNSYLKIESRCPTGSVNQLLYGVKNQNRLEKLQIQAIKKMKSSEKIAAAKKRIDFISSSLKADLAVAEVYIHMLWLREYASIAKRSKIKELKEYLLPRVREIRENQKKIFTNMILFDSDLLVNEFASVIYDEKAGEVDKGKAKSVLEMHWRLRNEVAKNAECLVTQKCFVCVDKIENKICDNDSAEYKKIKNNQDENFTGALVRHGEAAASLEKLISRLENAIK